MTLINIDDHDNDNKHISVALYICYFTDISGRSY